MALSDLISPTALKLAIDECDRLGRERFLKRYGFKHSRDYPLMYNGREYDSKAIVGVAHGYQFPKLGPLKYTDFSGGIATTGAASKAFALGFDVVGLNRRETDWTLAQCEAAVEAYFDCLRKKLAGQEFNRAQSCRSVATTIDRSVGSVDYKFQNIDAVLFENGLPRIMDGIAANAQQLLRFVVLDPLAAYQAVFGTAPDSPLVVDSVDGIFVDPPNSVVPEPDSSDNRAQVTRKIDYAARDANNRSLGRRGEEWVMSVERRRLSEAGRSDLAEQVDWVSDRVGDGLGYDLVSFDENGNELFIEVKTTNADAETPFFISPNELAVSGRLGIAFRLYRVFDFSSKPRVYVLSGPLTNQLALTPRVFAALPCKVGSPAEDGV